MLDFRRTHTCGELRLEQISQKVQLSGWVHNYRNLGGLMFITIRDRYGVTQLVFDPEKNPLNCDIATKLRAEWVISVHGTVISRSEGMANSKMPTGEIEITADKIEVLSKSQTPPFSISDEHIDVNEELRLKHRYLDIRRGDIMDKLIARHKSTQSIRSYLDGQGFLDIYTPILAKSTPEGARDYLVPSRIYPGTFYALPQSPQIFKQLLMISGVDKYFQIAPCFRDEDLRADRQPEFMQIDIEMSFATPEEIFFHVESMIKSVFQANDIEIKAPFQRLTYQECMDKYGSDKPDLRFGMELHDISHIAGESDLSIFKDQVAKGGTVKALLVKGGEDISRKGIDNYTKFVGGFGIRGLAWMKLKEEGLQSSIVKFFSPEQQKSILAEMEMKKGDLIFIIADKINSTNQGLDHLRRKLAEDRQLIKKGSHALLWVTEFPLLTWNDEDQRHEAEHHPFTAIHPEDIDLLDSDPTKVRSMSYDLVIDGYEIASGSQRIHNEVLQKKIFEFLKLSEEDIQERFGFFVDALKYGTPPHVGIGLGLERLMMTITNTNNVRDVVAFPKTQKAADLMSQAPSEVDPEQLKELHIKSL